MPSLHDTVIRLKVGTKVKIKDEDDSPFEGIVNKVESDTRNFTVYLEMCHKVGSEKVLNGLQEFHSDTVETVEIIEEKSSGNNEHEVKEVKFVEASVQYVKNNITKDLKVQIKRNQKEEIYEGIVTDLLFLPSNEGYCIILSQCRKLGSLKTYSAPQEFLSDEIISIGLVTSSSKSESALQENMATNHLYPVVKNKKQHLANEVDLMAESEHLSRLFPIQMNELLAQNQIVPPPIMKIAEQLPLKPKLLPIPVQETSHMTGKAFVDKDIPQYRTIREFTWIDRNTPPHLMSCPTNYYMIDKEVISTKEFKKVKEELFSQSMVGFSMQGSQGLSRLGEASLIGFSTKKSLFLFDVLSLGLEWCFGEEGLVRDILEDQRILKVIHDCRAMSDMLKNKFNVILTNVYDTLAAHVVFSTWAIYSGYMPRYAMPLSDLIRGYLGVAPEFIAFQHARNYAKKKDSEIWMTRPISPELEMIAVYESMYLLDLQRATREAMNKPFFKMTEILLNDVSSADELDCAMKIGNLQQLPLKCASVLPNWKPDDSKACRFGVLEDGFVHQSTCQLDPMLNFSRDVMHAKKPPGDYHVEKS